MLIDGMKIQGRGIKGQDVITRWNKQKYDKLVILFIENAHESRNIEFLLENYLEQVIDGIKICMETLNIQEVVVYVSDEYIRFKSTFEKRNISVFIVKEPKKHRQEIFKENTLVHHGETILALYRKVKGLNIADTRILTIVGDINAQGVFEVPLNMKIEDIIDIYGKGVREDSDIRFVQVGGNSGTVFSPMQLKEPFQFSSIIGDGFMVAAAKIEIFNNQICIVEWVKDKMLALSKASCGTCVYCREGIFQLYKIMKDATEGKSKEIDIDIVGELINSMQLGSLCDFGKTAANPLSTSLALFSEEFSQHMDRKKCPTLVCVDYINFYINPDVCVGCGKCQDVCQSDAISGSKDMIHIIDMKTCEKCTNCEKACENKAVNRYGSIKPKCPLEPVPVGSFSSTDLNGGLGKRRRRKKSQ